MRAVVVCCALVVIGCGHKKPKDAKSSAPATASAPEANKCEVKGFAYSVPAPGPITDGGAQ
jgi:hypothetical protein